MAKKDSFVLYTEQKAVLDKLTDEQAGKLIKAIYEYEETGIMPELDSTLDLVITPFKTALDKNGDKWEKTKQKRSEAGKLGAEKRWNGKPKKEIAKIANAKSANGKMAKIAVNVNVNDNKKENIKEKSVDAIFDSIEDQDIKQALIDFSEMRNKIKKPLTARALNLIIKRLNEITNNKEEQLAIIDKSIVNNWIGVFELNEKEKEKYIKPDEEKKVEYIVNTMTEEEYWANFKGG